jgi:hypothetical protein
MSMKWYFAISESSLEQEDHDWRGLIRVAVESARQRTRLSPNMLYDGEPNDFAEGLRQEGVSIIRVPFYRELSNTYLKMNGTSRLHRVHFSELSYR